MRNKMGSLAGIAAMLAASGGFAGSQGWGRSEAQRKADLAAAEKAKGAAYHNNKAKRRAANKRASKQRKGK